MAQRYLDEGGSEDFIPGCASLPGQLPQCHRPSRRARLLRVPVVHRVQGVEVLRVLRQQLGVHDVALEPDGAETRDARIKGEGEREGEGEGANVRNWQRSPAEPLSVTSSEKQRRHSAQADQQTSRVPAAKEQVSYGLESKEGPHQWIASNPLMGS